MGSDTHSALAELAEAVGRREVLLFVGAGISATLGVPPARTLIGRMAEDLGTEAGAFHGFSDALTLAEYYLHQRGSLEPLREWMTTTTDGEPIEIAQSAIHKAIVDLDLPVIYTTNYDPWLERAYEAHGRRYQKIVRVWDLACSEPGATQIVKLHGDLSDESSIVFTESDYFERLALESPLDIKLRADVLARSVLFVGYSLSDLNIRYLLYRLQRQWERDGRGTEQPRSYLFMRGPDPVHEAVLRLRGIEPIVSAMEDPADGLLELLWELTKAR